jgi:hypothetical protein
MRYLVLAYGEQEKVEALTKEEMTALGARCRDYDEELRRTGKLVAGFSLGWGSTSLRLRGGKLAVTDGPYIDTKEVVGGLVILEARDLNEAIQLASLHPAARMGEELGWGIELRPMEVCQLLADP